MKIPRYGWYLIACAAVVVVVKAIQIRLQEAEQVYRPAPETGPRPTVRQRTEETNRSPAKPAMAKGDLTLIKGIGPARATKLQQAGITTYAALAGTATERLKEFFPRVSPEGLEDWKAQARALS
ncbi:MAG TPA: helix-hairpin-helix domain-containing protein [Anaerolineae bacterium]|jgi:predicted flap endonuclease-1-like 5' DNA nuclease